MAGAGEVVQGTQYDAATMMKYTKPKPMGNQGGKQVGILNANVNKQTKVNTPLMTTWGVNEWPSDTGGPSKYDMSLQFPKDEYSTPSQEKFLENMKAFEAKLKADALVNSKEWFGKNITSPDVIDALYTPMLRYPKKKDAHGEPTGELDFERPPTLKIKIPYWEGKFGFKVFNDKKKRLYPLVDEEGGELDDAEQPAPLDFIAKGAKVAVQIVNGGIWFAGGKFGTNWKLRELVVKPKEVQSEECSVTLDEDDMATLRNQSSTAAEGSDEETVQEPANVTMNAVSTEVADSDEEDDADETTNAVSPEPEPEPEPPAPAKKKRVVKKKKAADDDED